MACESKPSRRPNKARRDEVREAVARLEAAMKAGTVTVKVGPTGAITFAGWGSEEREGVSDVCAYRKLAASGSAALRAAVAKAEAMAGRKVDARAIAAGVHSHDGGHSWHQGHK